MLALLGTQWPALGVSYVEIGPLLAELPRGDIYLFNTIRLGFVLAFFLACVKTLAWLDADADRSGMPRPFWNLVFFSCATTSVALFFVLPAFGLDVVLMLFLYLGPLSVYILQRNLRVPPAMRLFTVGHFQRLLGGKAASDVDLDQGKESGKKGGAKAGKKASKKNAEKGGDSADENENEEDENMPAKVIPPIRFISRDRKSDDEEAQEIHIEKSSGMQAAIELIWEALQSRATDIHLEPARDEMLVRFRIDSIMQPVPSYSRQRGDSILNIFKNLGALDITEKRKPQDGSFTAEIDKRNVDFRVATAGSVNGEKMVMRILDSAKQMKGLADIGLPTSMRLKIEEMIAQSNGMLITCGPTGAGKTSTLYSCLREIDRFQRNVITLENPVEYHLDNVTQIEVNDKAGKTFANELRSILRQDPDVILIGEIRDAETAEIACQSAQTGHIVLTTMHAIDTVTALARLIDLGVKPFMIAGSLNGVLAQRLVRVLCPKCKIALEPPADLLKKFRVTTEKVKAIYRAAEPEDRPTDANDEPIPCKHCKGAGYLGRTGVFELLILNDEIRTLIRQPSIDVTAIKQAAIKNGLTTLFDDGQRKVLEGKTSIAELQRAAK